MKIHWIKINKIIDETPEIKTYILDCPKDFIWEEGAHTHLALEGFNAGDKPNRDLIRHMSISTLPHENSIGITTRIKEDCSIFKKVLRKHKVGDEVALFKTHSNVPLKREGRSVYLLSAGVGLATFRPLALEYFADVTDIKKLHSLNIDSTREYLFTDIFITNHDRNFTSEFVDNRQDYYDKVKNLTTDQDGLFYIVGSDEFIKENINLLFEQGIQPEQIMLDKRQGQLADFLPIDEIA